MKVWYQIQVARTLSDTWRTVWYPDDLEDITSKTEAIKTCKAAVKQFNMKIGRVMKNGTRVIYEFERG